MPGEVAFSLILEAEVHGKLALYGLEHIEDRNVLCLPCQGKTALHAAVGTDDLGLHELLKDLGEETPRYLVLLGYLGDETDLLVGLPCKIEDAADAVIAFAGQLHVTTIANC